MTHDQVIIGMKGLIVGSAAGGATLLWGAIEPVLAEVSANPASFHSMVERSVSAAVVAFFLWWLVESNKLARKDAEEVRRLAQDEKKHALELAAQEKLETIRLSSKEKEATEALTAERERQLREQVQALQRELVTITRVNVECLARNIDALSDTIRTSQTIRINHKPLESSSSLTEEGDNEPD